MVTLRHSGLFAICGRMRNLAHTHQKKKEEEEAVAFTAQEQARGILAGVSSLILHVVAVICVVWPLAFRVAQAWRGSTVCSHCKSMWTTWVQNVNMYLFHREYELFHHHTRKPHDRSTNPRALGARRDANVLLSHLCTDFEPQIVRKHMQPTWLQRSVHIGFAIVSDNIAPAFRCRFLCVRVSSGLG